MTRRTKKTEIVLNLAVSELERQLDSIDQLDKKAGALAGFALAILGYSLRKWELVGPIWPAPLAFLVSAFLAMVAMNPRDWIYTPSSEWLAGQFPMIAMRDLTERLIRDVPKAVESNKAAIERKVVLFRAGVIAIFGGFVWLAMVEAGCYSRWPTGCVVVCGIALLAMGLLLYSEPGAACPDGTKGNSTDDAENQ